MTLPLPRNAGGSRRLVRYLLSGSAWALLGKGGAAIGVLLENALLARLLSPGDLGLYYLAFSVSIVGATIAQLGLNQSIVRFVAAAVAREELGRARSAVIRSLLFVLAAGTLLLVVLVTWPGRWLFGKALGAPALVDIAPLVAIWSIALALGTVATEALRGLWDVRLASLLARPARSLLSAGLVGYVLLATGNASLRVAITLTVAATAGATCLSLLALVRNLWRASGGGPITTPEIAQVSAPIFATQLLGTAGAQSIFWLLGILAVAEDVALYGAASRLATTIILPTLILDAVLAPVVADAYGRRTTARIEPLLRAASLVAAVPTGLFIIALLLGSESLLTLIYGPFFEGASAPLLVLAFAQLTNALTGVCALVLVMTGHQKSTLASIAAGTAITMLLSVVLMPVLGALGGALASAAGLASQNAIMWWVVRRRLGIWTHPGIAGVRPLIATVLKRGSPRGKHVLPG